MNIATKIRGPYDERNWPRVGYADIQTRSVTVAFRRDDGCMWSKTRRKNGSSDNKSFETYNECHCVFEEGSLSICGEGLKFNKLS